MRDGAPVLIDWERSGLARPELDLAALLGSIVALVLQKASTSTGDASEVRGAIETALKASRSMLAAALNGYLAAGGARPDPWLLGGNVGNLLVCRAYTTSVVDPHDRTLALLLDVGVGLIEHPMRWRALCPSGGEVYVHSN
ncbi:hypothetical protein GCM10017557_53400 [Streptomyces aurantiacus]|uniref:Aminoglycoside phosphotransferase domain-containing protein n=1 Tax=Streptomyces aurantiacus TaxID=47760 RepID=A0A7G1P732_9ACTN|nr:hypothetical protein GCM10017557_53400 [Streptomyces aurantiacus]